MADYQKTVEVIFGAVDNLSGTLQTIGGGVENFAGAVAGATAPLDNLADFVKTADAAIVGLGLAFGGLALQKSGEFRDSVAQIGVLFDGTGEQVRQFGDDILGYAANSTVGLNDITGALNDAIGSGVEWGKSLEFLAESENLALGASGTLNQATNVLISTMNAYGSSVDEAGKYTDVLMQTVLYGKTTLPELEQSLANVTSTAAAAKVPFDDVGAALAALTAAGLPTSQAITALNQVIAQYISPTKAAKDAADALGIQFDAQSLASKGLKGSLDEVMQATGGNVTEMSKLFGSVDSLKGAIVLGADSAGTFKTALEAMTTAQGSAARAAETLAEQWGVALGRMGNATDTLLIAVGDKLNAGGEFSAILDALRNTFSTLTFSIKDGAFDSVFATLEGVAGRVAEFLRAVAAALPQALESLDLTKFNAGILSLTDGLAGLFDDVDLTTPEGLGQALQLVADSIGNLLATGAGIADTWGEILDSAIPLIQAFADMSTESSRTGGAVLGVGDAIAAIAPLVGSLGGALDALGLAMNAIALKSAVDMALSFDALLLKIPGATTAATLLGTALGTGGLVAAAGAAGYAVGTVLNDGIDYVVQSLTGSDSLGGLIYDLVNSSDDLADAAPAAARGMQQVADAAADAADYVPPLAQATEKLTTANDALTDSERALVQPLEQAGKAAGLLKTQTEFLAAAKLALQDPTEANTSAMYEAARAYDYTAQAAGKTEEASAVMRAEFDRFNTTAKELPKPIRDSGDALEELAGKADLTNKELLELAVKLKDAEVKLEDIASNERIKNIEAQVSLDIAEVEANAQVATRILENLSDMYQADVGLIGELAGQITDGYSSGDRFRMQLISEASERIEEMHQAQLQQIAAYTDYMRRKASAIASGSPILTLNADGLQPHLEGIMWEIFKEVQIKLSQEGGDLIVGGLT